MAQRIGGFRRKTRHKLSKPVTDKGKLSLTRFFQEFSEGERVVLKAESSYQKGMYMPRFHGKNGIVKKKIGRCYEIAFKDSGKDKKAIIHPVHLKRMSH
ncbi:MAG: 50S ribosomal protein L21e [Candidatus Woesearchaeota archaeon]